jgi:hypothetical protein
MELVANVSETDKSVVVEHRTEAQHSISCKGTRVLAKMTVHMDHLLEEALRFSYTPTTSTETWDSY